MDELRASLVQVMTDANLSPESSATLAEILALHYPEHALALLAAHPPIEPPEIPGVPS